MLSFKPTFSLSSFTFIKKLFSSSSLSAIRVVSSAYLRLLIFLPAIYPMLKVRNGGSKEIPLVQGKEQWLCFAGAAVKRYPTPKGKRNPNKMVAIERGNQRADRLKPQSQKTSQSDHTDHSLVSLSETKPCSVGPHKMHGSWGRGLTECGRLVKGMANHFSTLALRTQ